jgi:hypothetical protein
MLALTERVYPMNTKTVWEESHTDTPGQVTTPPEEALLSVLPADEPVVTVNEDSALGLVELLLKNPGRVEHLNRDQTRLPLLVPRFLIIALASYALFAVAMIGIFELVPAAALPSLLPTNGWSKAAAVGLLLGYTIGLVAASGVCLPSFYFYGLLAGVKISMLQVVAQTLKGAAATAIMLIGVLPIYVAVTLGLCVFNAPEETMTFWLYLGLGLPFLAGWWGLRSIYLGFVGLADTLPPERRCRRECFLRRLTVSWTGVYAAVSPVMIYRLWEYFAQLAV